MMMVMINNDDGCDDEDDDGNDEDDDGNDEDDDGNDDDMHRRRPKHWGLQQPDSSTQCCPVWQP